MGLLDTLLENPGVGTPVLILSVCIGIPVLGGTIVSVARLLVKHRERLAMIEHGIHPDAPSEEPDGDTTWK